MLNGPAKITLKNTTKMTLNARFTTIMKSRPPTSDRSSSSRSHMASEKNRRLAQQMEERTNSSYDGGYGNSRPGPSRDYTPRDRAPAPRPKPQPVSVLDRIGNKPIRGGGRGGFRGGRGGSALNRTRGGGVRGRFSNGNRQNNSYFRGGRGRGRGRGGRGRDTASKDDLDAEMDAYRADRD